MARLLKSPRILLLAAALALAGLAAPLPATAGQLQHQQFRGDNGGNNGDAPVNLDRSPCGQQFGRHHGQGGDPACNDTEAFSQHSGNNGQRHPGSSAFGLQFNYAD